MRVENLQNRIISFNSLARMIVLFEKVDASSFNALLMNYLENDNFRD